MTSLIQVRVEKELKEEAEELFNHLGLDTTTALRMFLKEVVREQRIPLNLSVKKPTTKQELSNKNERNDPFYSEANVMELKRRIKELNEGKGITFTWAEFEEFSKAAENAKTKKEQEALIKRAKKGWSNV